MALIVESIAFSYENSAEKLSDYPDRPALLFDDFSLRVEAGDLLAVLGPSGCGKTTLLKLIAGLLRPSAGSIRLEGGEKGAQSSERIPTSFIFQEPRLFPWRTVEENVALPIEASFGKREARARALRFLDAVGLADSSPSYPDALSGGQRQRVSVARAFAYPASLVLMDEPFQSLDLPLRIQLMDLTLKLLADEHRTAIAVTHDPREAIYLAGRAVVLAGLPARIVMDEAITLKKADRAYSSAAAAVMEARLFASLSS